MKFCQVHSFLMNIFSTTNAVLDLARGFFVEAVITTSVAKSSQITA